MTEMSKEHKEMNSYEQTIEELRKEKAVLEALCVDYTSIYYCDLMNDSFIPIKCAEYNNASAAIKRVAEQSQSYSASIQYYYDHFVIKESAPDFLEKLSVEHLKKHLSQNQRFAYRYRVNPNKRGQQYFEVQVVRLMEEDGFKVIMGYRYSDDLVAEQERLQTELENALAEARLNNEIIGCISQLYWLIYRIDLQKETYEEISASDETHRLTGRKGYISDILQFMLEKIAADEYRPMMREFWNVSNLADRLQDTDSIAIEYRTRAGSWNLARLIAQQRDAKGHAISALYVVRKIDQEKKKELEYKQRLMEAAEEARRANVAKTDFLRRMSHDIRTPINGIQGMITIAEHFPEDLEKQTECREKIKEATGFLLDLVNNILDMNKLESGKIVLEHQPFDLLEVLERINDIARMNAASHGITVKVDHSGIHHRHLIGSPLHLKQILQNIDGNAIKYNREGGSISCAAHELRCVDGRVYYQFVCSDTGRGMSKEFLTHAFEPFAQEDSSARTSYMGTGLGLAIVKQLTEMMGGTIEVESEQHVGTTFKVTLPFELDTEYPKHVQVAAPESEADFSGRRVLLVEDNALNQEIARFMLENAGMKVTTAENGKEAVEIFQDSNAYDFDLILMDVMMPVMDGLTATRTIRALPRADAQTIPIFAMTANAFTDDIEESHKAGMNEHLSKPLDAEKLLATIQRYV